MNKEEKIIEEFYDKFSFIQAIKNEKSGNAYTRISDWLSQKLQQHRKEVIEEVKEKIEKRKDIEIVKLENTKNLPDRYYHKGKIHEQKDIQELLDNLLK